MPEPGPGVPVRWPLPARLAAVALAALLAYGVSLRNVFSWDDTHFILNNAFLWYSHDLPRLVGIDTGEHSAILNRARPVWILSAMLDVQVWGKDPFGHHLTSLVLHILNAWLVLGLARAAGASHGAALAAALLFAAHPLAAEPVCAASLGRPDLLCGLGMGLIANRANSPMTLKGSLAALWRPGLVATNV